MCEGNFPYFNKFQFLLSITDFFSFELQYNGVDFWRWIETIFSNISNNADIFTSRFHGKRKKGVMWFSSSSFENFLSNLFLHHDDHAVRCTRQVIEKMKEDGTRDIIGDIRNDRICFICWSKFENVLVMKFHFSSLNVIYTRF